MSIFEVFEYSPETNIEPLKLYIQQNPNWYTEILGMYDPINDIDIYHDPFSFCSHYIDKSILFRTKYSKILNYLKLQYFLHNNN